MHISGVTGWVLRVATTALLATAPSSFAIAEEAPNQKRQNLVDLAISPGKFVGQMKRVFCPIKYASTMFVDCRVLNENLRTVGTVNLFVKPSDPSTYSRILNNCTGEDGDNDVLECTFEIDVFVAGDRDAQLLEARQFYQINQ